MDTNPQALATLQEIRGLLQVLVWIAALAAVLMTVRTVTYLYVTWRQIKSEGFEAIASPLYRQGKLDRLIQLCQEEIAETPDNPYAHWYLGLVNFDRGSADAARTHFTRALTLVPSWRPSVEPYLEKLSGPTGG